MPTGTVDVPVAGKVKKQHLYYVAGGVGVLAAYRWFTTRGGSADDVEFGDGYDEFGNLLGSDPAVVSPGSGAGLTDNTPTTSPFAFNNNAEWSQWVIDYLVDSGVPREKALAAVGDYIAHLPLSVAEQGWMRGARAAAGPPPQGGPYEVIPEQPGTVVQPNTTVGPVLGLRWDFIGPTSLTLRWNAAPNAKSYRVTHTILTGTGRGTTGTKTVTGTSFTSVGLSKNTQHRFVVVGVSGANKTGPSATITGTTRRK